MSFRLPQNAMRPLRFHLFGKKVVITFPFLVAGENPWGEDHSDGKEASNSCHSLPNCLVAFWNDNFARVLEPYFSLSDARMSAMTGGRCIVLESDTTADVMDLEKDGARGMEDIPQPQHSMRVRPEDIHLISGGRFGGVDADLA